MIHNFSFENFYSFKKENEVSMLVNEKAPDNDFYFKHNNNRFNKILGVLGANGSGKTCLLRAISFLGWFMVSSFALEPEEEIPVKPFMLNQDSARDSVSIGAVFETKKRIYKYKAKLTPKKVIFEELKYKTDSGYRILFSRAYNKNKKSYDFNLKNFGLGKEFELTMKKRNNASIISTAYQFKHEESVEIFDFFKCLYNINICEQGRIKSDNLFLAAKSYNDDNKTKEKVEAIIQQLDLGLVGIKIKKTETEDAKKIDIPFGIHQTRDNREVEVPFFYESSGTQSLFVILKDVVRALDKGGVVIFDEIDSDLHPQIVMFIVDLFKNKKTNKHNAQLIFSTHSFLVLDKLEKYQIQFTEKNKYGECSTWRLDEKKGTRLDDNYLAKYLKGDYGAFPKINLIEEK